MKESNGFIQRLREMTHIECIVICAKDLDLANKGSKWKYLTNDL